MNHDDVQNVLTKHVAWVEGKHGGERANLSWADLSGANLSGANLRWSKLSESNLRWADLSMADLRGADLNGADLSRAYLSGADFSYSDLSNTKLIRTNLSKSNLSGANLSDSDLSKSNLSGADLRGADLNGTVLDPRNVCHDATHAIINAGMIIATDESGHAWVHGYRTRRSQHNGSTVYRPGRYQSPVFSTDVRTDCHPGLYFAARSWLTVNYPSEPLLPVMARLSQVVATANGKFRARELWVLA